jgi:phosphatidylserine decarboxylase
MSNPVATFAAAQLLRFVPRVRLSRAVGRLCEQELPPAVSGVASRLYARAYGVNLAEAEPTALPYRSFDDFFTRKLRPGARVIADAPIICPSDGKLVSVGNVSNNSEIIVKGRPYDVAELCGSLAAGERYKHGEFCVVYLHPRDYHRVHSPVAGSIHLVRSLPGDLFPVNSIGERHVPKLFVRNQRVAISIQSPELGEVTVILVGATIVGRISTTVLGGDTSPLGEHRLSPPVPVAQGDEVGVFHLGSTVVLLFEGQDRLSRATGPVRFGESLVRR